MTAASVAGCGMGRAPWRQAGSLVSRAARIQPPRGVPMSLLTASLPMYNLPEMRAANAAFWKALSDEVAREGEAGLPEALVFSRPPVPDAIGATTVFSQTCGYPLLNIFRRQYQMLGIPTYDAPGC